MGEDMDVHLRWNHHQTTLLSVFSSLLSNETLVDCTISAEGQHFKAHRVILSACSTYFELLFSEHCETHPIVILPDVQFQILKTLMEFIYSGEVKVTQNNLCSFLNLAETLKIKGLSSVSEMKNELGPQRRNDSSILCDQQGFRKHLHEPRYDSQVQLKDVSSLHTTEMECSEDTDSCLLSAQKCDKNSSKSISSGKTIQEAAMFEDISDAEAVNTFRHLTVTKTLAKSNTQVSGTLLNSVSNILDSSQFSGSCKVKVGEQKMLSENVISTHLISKEVRTSEPIGVCSERPVADLLSQMKQEDPDDFKSNSIEEIILDDDSDESDNHNYDNGSGGDNSNTVRVLTRVVPEQSFSGQGFCSPEQYIDSYFVDPASILPKPYKCDACGRYYRYPRGLLSHLRFECGKEPQFTCPQCSRRFFHKRHLRRHIVIAHSPY